MPCKLWISVLAARDLPIMDAKGKNRSTDAFVEVNVPGSRKEEAKTGVCKRTVNPVWTDGLGSEMVFEIIDDSKLQDSPVQFKVKDRNIMTDDLSASFASIWASLWQIKGLPKWEDGFRFGTR